MHDEVLLRALAKRPGDRYPSADAMAEAVRAWPATSQWPALRLPAARRRDPTPAPTPAHTGDATDVPTAVEPAAREPLGPTARGQLFATRDVRVGRRVLVEELDVPLSAARARRP